MKGLILIALVSLSLSGNAQCTRCTSLSDALKNPGMVVSLKFNGSQSGTRLDSLSREIGLLINAEILYISDHNIETIPKEIGNLKKLKELSFAGCELESVPDEIFTLTNLKELILIDNRFTDKTKQALKVKFKKNLPNTMVLL